jgi:hypothetical protein
MWYSPVGAIAACMRALTVGGFPGFVLRSAVLFLAVYFVASSAVERPRRQIAAASLATAAVASAAYHVLWLFFALVGFGWVGVILGLVAAWVAVQAVPDKMLELGLEKARTLTTSIAVASFVAWLVIGVLLMLVGKRPA